MMSPDSSKNLHPARMSKLIGSPRPGTRPGQASSTGPAGAVLSFPSGARIRHPSVPGAELFARIGIPGMPAAPAPASAGARAGAEASGGAGAAPSFGPGLAVVIDIRELLRLRTAKRDLAAREEDRRLAEGLSPPSRDPL
jgi:hypothetical protein